MVWRKLSRENHPDKVKDEKSRKAAQERFMEIQQAFEILSNNKNRRNRRNKKDNSEPTNGSVALQALPKSVECKCEAIENFWGNLLLTLKRKFILLIWMVLSILVNKYVQRPSFEEYL